MLRLSGSVENNTSIDNVVANGGAVPEEDVKVHELGLLEVRVDDPRIVVWVRQGDAIRSASTKAVDIPGGQKLQNVVEDRMSPHVLAIALPEPGAYLSLFSALAGLGGLHQLRRWRSRVRKPRDDS